MVSPLSIMEEERERREGEKRRRESGQRLRVRDRRDSRAAAGYGTRGLPVHGANVHGAVREHPYSCVSAIAPVTY